LVRVARRLIYRRCAHAVRRGQLCPTLAFGLSRSDRLGFVGVAARNRIDRAQLAEAELSSILVELQFSRAHAGAARDGSDLVACAEQSGPFTAGGGVRDANKAATEQTADGRRHPNTAIVGARLRRR